MLAAAQIVPNLKADVDPAGLGRLFRFGKAGKHRIASGGRVGKPKNGCLLCSDANWFYSGSLVACESCNHQRLVSASARGAIGGISGVGISARLAAGKLTLFIDTRWRRWQLYPIQAGLCSPPPSLPPRQSTRPERGHGKIGLPHFRWVIEGSGRRRTRRQLGALLWIPQHVTSSRRS